MAVAGRSPSPGSAAPGCRRGEGAGARMTA